MTGKWLGLLGTNSNDKLQKSEVDAGLLIQSKLSQNLRLWSQGNILVLCWIHTHVFIWIGNIGDMMYIYMIPVRGSLPPPPPPHMVWSQNLRFAAFRMKTLYLQCFLHGGLLVRSATLQSRWIFATNLPKTCYLQCFGFDIVE